MNIHRWKWRKYTVMTLITALLLSMFQMGTAAANTSGPFEDGTYIVNYNYLAEASPYPSMANNYLKYPGLKGTLTIANGAATFEHTVIEEYSGYFPYLGIRKNGSPKAGFNYIPATGGLVAKDGYQEAYQEVQLIPVVGAHASSVSYQIQDLTKDQDVLMHIKIQVDQVNYDNWYGVQLHIDTSNIPRSSDSGSGDGSGSVTEVTYAQVNELITATRAVYGQVIEGTDIANYPMGSKDKLWSAITSADELLSHTGDVVPADYKSIYNALTAAKQDLVASRILPEQLPGILADAKALVSTAKRHGEVEGEVGGGGVFRYAGESVANNIDTVSKYTQLAEQSISDPSTKGSTLISISNTLPREINSAYDNLYVELEPMRIFVLDNPDEATQESMYASEIGDTVSRIVTKVNAEQEKNFYANITLSVIPDAGVRQGGTSFSTGKISIVPFMMAYAGLSQQLSNESQQVVQVSANSILPLEGVWEGLSFIKYSVNGVERQLYISYNADLLDQLKLLTTNAELLKQATKADKAVQADYDTAKENLHTAIDAAKPIVNNLASKRPAIRDAIALLQTAIAGLNEVVANDSHPLGFTVVHETEDKASSMNSYFVKPGSYTEKDGKNIVTLTLNDSKTVPSFKVEQAGEFVETTTVAEDAAANTRTIQFETTDLTNLIHAKVHVSTVMANGAPYEKDHTVRLMLYSNPVDHTVIDAKVKEAGALLAAAVAGDQLGQYPEAAKSALDTAIQAAKPYVTSVLAVQDEIDSAILNLQTAMSIFEQSVISATTPENPTQPVDPNKLADGTYSISYTFTVDGENFASHMDGYTVKPGKLVVSGDTMTFEFALKQSQQIPDFKIDTGSGLYSPSSISDANNTRKIQFTVPNLDTKYDAWVDVNWQEINYVHNYNVDLVFDRSSLQLDQGGTIEPGTGGGTDPGTGEGTTEPGAGGGTTEPEPGEGTGESPVEQPGSGTEQPGGNTEQPGSAIEQAIAFHIYKKGSDEQSVMYDYVEPNSGKLTVKDGKQYVSFTLKQNAEILSFKTEQDGVLVETEKVSEDLAANTRVVQFPVSHLKERLNGWVKIYWQLPEPMGLYAHEYEVELGFEEPVVKGQQLPLNFEVLHATQDKASSMNNYFLKPGHYTEVNGKKSVTLTLKDSTTVPSFKIEQDSQFIETKIVTEDAAANTRTVQFEVADFNTLLNGQVHVSTKKPDGSAYEMDYAIRLLLNSAVKTVLNEKITDAENQLKNAVVGTNAGQYPGSAKTTFETAIAAAKAIGSNVLAAQPAVDKGVQDLQQAIVEFTKAKIADAVQPVDSNKLADGTYNIDYSIHKDGSSAASIMDQYVLKPGKLIVSNGHMEFEFIVRQSNEITGFKINTGSGLNSPSVVGSSDTSNTRTFRFAVPDLDQTYSGWVKIYWPNYIGDGTTYDHEYDVDLVINRSSIRSYTGDPVAPSSAPIIPNVPAAAANTAKQDANQIKSADQFGTASAKKFSDTEHHWAKDLIAKAVQLGVVNGYEDGTFRPNNQVTRAELVALLSRGLKLKDSSDALSFTDGNLIPAWVKPQLAALMQTGIIKGYEDGSFKATRNVSRLELAVFMARALKLQVTPGDKPTFKDADQIPTWAQAEVAAMQKLGIMKGNNNVFSPNASATRAETIAVILSLYEM